MQGGGYVRRVLFAGAAVGGTAACTLIYEPDWLGDGVPVPCTINCSDGGGQDSGGAGVSDAGDAGAPRGCKNLGSVTFCRDFDDGASFNAGGFSVEAQQGNVTANSEASYSPARSLVANILGGSGSSISRFATMYRPFSGSPSNMRFAANVQLEQYDPGQEAAVFGIIVGNRSTGDEHVVLFAMGDQRATVMEQQQGIPMAEFDFPSGRLPPVGPGAWPRIEIRIASNPPHVWATLDGVGVVDANLVSALWQMPSSPQLHIGIGVMPANGGAWKVRYDDIVFDLR